MIKNKNIIIVGVGIIIVIALSIILILSLKKGPEFEENEEIDEKKLATEFDELFKNQENEYVEVLYNLKDEKSGKYNIETKIPYIHIENEFDNKVNKDINDIFVKKLLSIMNESQSYSTIKIDYATAINGNMVSLAIRCVLKEGSNPQRTIIKTYNYDIENNREIKLMDVIPEEKKEELQNKIYQEVENQIKREEAIIKQGFNIYRRDKESEIYILENATEFYIRNNILYIIYSYGNSNHTSEVDLIINKI